MISFSAEDILAIPLSSPERLFTEMHIKDEYKKFALQWHPDKNSSPIANDVLAHVNVLYKEGLEHIARGLWKVPGLLNLTSTDGTKYRIKYRALMPFELGEVYVCDTVVVYLTLKKFNHLYKNAVKTIGGFTYLNSNMKTEMTKYLPQIKKQFSTVDYDVLCISKNIETLPLSVVFKYLSPSVDPKHVAWILSSLHNVLCYLEYAKITHNDINLDTYFVSPVEHSGHLFGGWWYSVKTGSKLVSVPTNTYNHMSAKSKEGKTADKNVDNELARQVCRALLGDAVGSRLVLNKSIPKPLINWLRLPSSGNFVKDYSTWMKKVVIDAFGKRRYTPLHIDSEKAYKEFNK